jgi:dTDP-4-dehydrorhamnose reductase
MPPATGLTRYLVQEELMKKLANAAKKEGLDFVHYSGMMKS